MLRGLPHNVTTEMDLELWQASPDHRAISRRGRFRRRDVQALTAAYLQARLAAGGAAHFGRFLRRYGHRAVAEIDLGMPRWAGEPGHIVGVIVNYLRRNDPDLAPPRQFARGQAEAEAMLADWWPGPADQPLRSRPSGSLCAAPGSWWVCGRARRTC